MNEIVKEISITNFSPFFSMMIPAGIDINPYAIKNENGRRETSVRLKLNVLIISGISGPIIFVKNEITKKVNKTKPTKKGFFFTILI